VLNVQKAGPTLSELPRVSVKVLPTRPTAQQCRNNLYNKSRTNRSNGISGLQSTNCRVINFVYPSATMRSTVIGIIDIGLMCFRVISLSHCNGTKLWWCVVKNCSLQGHSYVEARGDNRLLAIWPVITTSIAEGPRDASCQLKSRQLPRNSAVRQVLNKSKLWSWRVKMGRCVVNMCTQPWRVRVAFIVL